MTAVDHTVDFAYDAFKESSARPGAGILITFKCNVTNFDTRTPPAAAPGRICPGYQTIVPKLDSRPKTRAARRFIADNASVRAGLVRDALDRVDELEAAAVKLEKQIEVLVKASTTSLTTLVGRARAQRR